MVPARLTRDQQQLVVFHVYGLEALVHAGLVDAAVFGELRMELPHLIVYPLDVVVCDVLDRVTCPIGWTVTRRPPGRD